MALCRSRLHFCQDAEDAAQESFLRIWKGLSALNDIDRFDAWLRSVAINACTDLHRKQPKQSYREDIDQCAMAAPNQRETDAIDEREYIKSLVAELDAPLSEVLLLFYYDELKYDEMAQWLNIARATVQERLAKARQKLRCRILQRRSPSHEL